MSGRTSNYEHFCKVEAEELNCGNPKDFYLAECVTYNCNKELQTRCEVSCAKGEPTNEFVQCSIKKGKVSWKPETLSCKAEEGNNFNIFTFQNQKIFD